MYKILLMLITLSTFVMASDTAPLNKPIKELLPFEKKLWNSLGYDKDYAFTRELLHSKPNYFKDLDYPSDIFYLGESYIEKNLDIETLTLLVENGLDVNQFTKRYVSDKAKKLMRGNGYGYKTFGSLDYGRLKEGVKTLLQENNISQENYYRAHRSHEDYFLESLTLKRTEPTQEIKWFVKYGYKISSYELNKSFLTAIQQENIDVANLWKELEKLGSSFKADKNATHEWFMYSVVNIMMNYHSEDIEALKFLIAQGLDINAKNNNDRGNAYSLMFSEDTIIAKRELQAWMALGLKIPTNSFYYLERESLIQISKMNLPLSLEAKKILDELTWNDKKSSIESWLMIPIYAPAQMGITFLVLTVLFLILFIIGLVKLFKKLPKR